MNEDPFKFQRQEPTVLTKKRIVIAIIVFFLFVAGWFIYNLTQSGTLELSASGKVADGTSVAIEITQDRTGQPSSDPIKLELRAGETKKISLKKGLVRVNASSGNIKSVNVVAIKGMATTKLATPQGEQHAIHKLGSNAQYCPGVTGGNLYSYNCGGDGQVYKHNPIDSNMIDTRTVAFERATFSIMQPFQKGAIGIMTAQEDSHINLLKFANFETGNLEDIPLPADIARFVNDEFPNLITSPDPSKPYFLLVFTTANKAFLFKNVGDTRPVVLDLPKNAALHDDFGITTFEFYGDRIITYAGQADDRDIDEAPPQSDETKGYGNNVYEFTLDGKLARTIDLPKDFRSTGAAKVTDNFYTMEQNTGLEFYHYNGKALKKVYELHDAGDPLVLDGTAYTVVNGTLYSFKGGTEGQFSLQSVFSSAGVRVSRLFKTLDGIVFTGSAARQEQPPLDIFQLLDSGQTTPPVEETVSLDRLKNIINGYDYDDKTIAFGLRSTGFGFSYEEIRSTMEAKLKELGMDVGGRRVELYPLN